MSTNEPSAIQEVVQRTQQFLSLRRAEIGALLKRQATPGSTTTHRASAPPWRFTRCCPWPLSSSSLLPSLRLRLAKRRLKVSSYGRSRIWSERKGREQSKI